MKRIWRAILAISITLLVFSTVNAITRIVGGAVDSTPSVTPAAPTSFTLVTAAGSGVFAIASNGSGLFAGLRNADGFIYTSTNGSTWTVTATQPVNVPNGIQYISSRILTIDNLGAACEAEYSDNLGVSWTIAAISPTFGCSADTKNTLVCNGATCYVAGKSGNNARAFISTNSGTSWAQIADWPGGHWVNGNAIRAMAYDGSSWVVSGRGMGPDNSPTQVYKYTLNGVAVLSSGCGVNDNYYGWAGTASDVIGSCGASLSSFFGFITGSSITFSPAIVSSPVMTVISLTGVSPSTTFVGTKVPGTNFGVLYKSTNGTTFTSLSNTGVVQNFGQFTKASAAVAYVGTDLDSVYKLQ